MMVDCFGELAPGPAAPERPESDDAREHDGSAGIGGQGAVDARDCAKSSKGPLPFTVYSARQPRALTKIFRIVDGKLKKTAAASIALGTAERGAAPSLRELADVLDGLQPHQAVSWGITTRPLVNIVPEHDEDPDEGRIGRTRRNFTFAPGPGVMMLDHDGAPGGALGLNELRARLVEACPPLSDAPMLCRPSVSAGLVGPDGKELTGRDRWRIYIAVADATLIPEAGKRLVTLLWAAGSGWHEVGNAGQALARTLVDASVWQPERLDFAAPPVLMDGIRRDPAAPVFFNEDAPLLDLRKIDAAAEQKAADKRLRESRAAIRPQCAERARSWADERAPALAHRRGISTDDAHALLLRAGMNNILMGDFELTPHDGATITVAEVLDHPDRWHGARFADPLDPDEDRRVAWVNLKSGTRPMLWSHRHGGVRFELMRQSARVEVGRGLRIATTDATLQVLRDRGELFDFGEGAVAAVAAGRARPVNAEWLTDHMGRVCDYYSVKMTPDGDRIERPDDAPPLVARAILAKHDSRGFKRLVAVVTAPTLRPDGSVLDEPGHDDASGLLYFNDDPHPPRVPVAPTLADALDALRVLWRPFRRFPLVDDVDRGVLVHGLFTAAVRAALPTAPGIALDAPAAGTGKTLVGRCIGILATGAEPAILPPADSEDETRKRLFAALRDGHRVLLWDNVREPLGGAALDSFLTAATFADRILGVSETVALPNRAQFIATGNNIRLTGDTCRRIFVARLDAQIEQPYARDFDFDPAQICERDRLPLIVAALTIIRAWITAGRPRVLAGRTASFETWDDLVRQPIGWIAEHARGVDGLPALADPLLSAQRAFDADPESTKLRALLSTWWAEFNDMPKTVPAAVARAGDDGELRAALDEVAGQGGRINNRMLGRWIERHQGRRIAGLRFERGSVLHGVQTWRVRICAPAPENKPTSYTKHTPTGAPEAGDGAGLGVLGGLGVFVSRYRRANSAADGDEGVI